MFGSKTQKKILKNPNSLCKATAAEEVQEKSQKSDFSFCYPHNLNSRVLVMLSLCR